MSLDWKTRFPWKVTYPGGRVLRYHRKPTQKFKPAFSIGFRGFPRRTA